MAEKLTIHFKGSKTYIIPKEYKNYPQPKGAKELAEQALISFANDTKSIHYSFNIEPVGMELDKKFHFLK